MRQHRLRGAQDSQDVGIEQRLGLGNRGFLRRAEQAHAGTVDQHVDAPRLGDDGLDRLPHRRLVTDIHLDQFDTGHWLGCCPVAHAAKHPATAFGKALRGGAADAPRHPANNDNRRTSSSRLDVGLMRAAPA